MDQHVEPSQLVGHVARNCSFLADCKLVWNGVVLRRLVFNFVIDLNATNDIWEFDTQSLNWTLIQANQPESYVTNGGYPSARSGAAVAVDANGIWIFGGRTTDSM